MIQTMLYCIVFFLIGGYAGFAYYNHLHSKNLAKIIQLLFQRMATMVEEREKEETPQ